MRKQVNNNNNRTGTEKKGKHAEEQNEHLIGDMKNIITLQQPTSQPARRPPRPLAQQRNSSSSAQVGKSAVGYLRGEGRLWQL